MRAYQEIVNGYRKRHWEEWMDAAMAMPAVCCAAPGPVFLRCLCGAAAYIVLAVQEGARAVCGIKPGRNALLDAGIRAIRMALATCVGMLAAFHSGVGAGMAAAAWTRLLLGRCRPRALTGWRVQRRILRLRELNAQLRRHELVHPKQKESRESGAYSFTDGEKSAIMKRDSS